MDAFHHCLAHRLHPNDAGGLCSKQAIQRLFLINHTGNRCWHNLLESYKERLAVCLRGKVAGFFSHTCPA